MRLNKKGLDAYQKVVSSSTPSRQASASVMPKPDIKSDMERPLRADVKKEESPASPPVSRGVRRSAELLMMMGTEAANEALSHMSVEEIRQVMAEVSRIKAEKAHARANQAEQVDGMDTAKGFLKTAFGEDASARILRTAVPDLVEKPFSFLSDIPEEQVVALLKDESIEILAIILPRIKPLTAKRVLESVAPFEQTDLIKRIVKVKRVDTEVITRIEEVLQERLRLMGKPVEQEEFDGQEALVQILRYMSADKERDILDKLAGEEPTTARAIEQQLFTIDALTWMQPKDLQARLQALRNDELAILIKAKSQPIRDLILASLSKRRMDAVLQEEALMGLIAKREVDRVTREFLDQLRDEEREGKLVLIRPGESFL
ncbi:FliG C-terminal domain-containing protein [Entomospira culicis]|uniref:Flagellar motor switch protein FliG n=2 Tax=Entomospira culicis TaxID=2719989 RepID=A0A968GE32_9SPIO|nr:FliG C-terminal domain-containing protein [Entomospira culicis]NIZ18623.1 hypothetical protein [Entomospira culicis]NIZ68838.1 hypothetical protein [Entomospira culicis]WDI39060.1 FliG C-terminal domain-containing protein [Entomospira culicis]